MCKTSPFPCMDTYSPFDRWTCTDKPTTFGYVFGRYKTLSNLDFIIAVTAVVGRCFIFIVLVIIIPAGFDKPFSHFYLRTVTYFLM